MESAHNLIVVKFGGACFEHFTQYAKICDRILALKERPVVVASARKGMTDALLQDAASLGIHPGTPACDLLLSTGELQSAASLVSALIARGAPAVLLRPELIFTTDDSYGDASILRVDTRIIRAAYDTGMIPVVPGFYGAFRGTITTLGRGGSDYSAVALGVELRAKEVRLYKAEVDGIYDKDPNVHADALRYRELSHREVLEIATHGGKVVQEKSARLALASGIELSVRPAFGDGEGTVVKAGRNPPIVHLADYSRKRVSAKEKLGSPVFSSGLS